MKKLYEIKITIEGLNAVIDKESGTNGNSPLLCLATTNEGQQLLINDKILRGKITAQGLIV